MAPNEHARRIEVIRDLPVPRTMFSVVLAPLIRTLLFAAGVIVLAMIASAIYSEAGRFWGIVAIMLLTVVAAHFSRLHFVPEIVQSRSFRLIREQNRLLESTKGGEMECYRSGAYFVLTDGNAPRVWLGIDGTSAALNLADSEGIIRVVLEAPSHRPAQLRLLAEDGSVVWRAP